MRRGPSAILVLLGVALAAPLLAGKSEDAQKALKTLTTGKKAADRASAAETLGALRAAEAVPALAAALRDSDDEVRGRAAYSLWELRESAAGSEAAIRAALAEETDGRTTLTEIATLESLGLGMGDLVPALERALRDPDLDVRVDAARTALGHLPPERLLPIAIEGLAQGSDRRTESAQLLSELRETGDRRLIPLLIDAANHGDNGQVQDASTALALFDPRPPEALPLLQRLLEDRDPDVRRSAAGNVSRFLAAAKPAVPRLIQLLEDPSDDVREAAAGAIDTIGRYTSAQLSAIPALIKAFETTRKSHARETIVHTLGYMGPAAKAAIPALSKEIDNPDVSLRDTVRGTLAQIAPKH